VWVPPNDGCRIGRGACSGCFGTDHQYSIGADTCAGANDDRTADHDSRLYFNAAKGQRYNRRTCARACCIAITARNRRTGKGHCHPRRGL